MDYSKNFGSNFPTECITLNTHKDVDSSVVSLINQYNTYVQNGDMTSASTFYTKNKNTLEAYILDTSYLNRLEEEIYNTGLYAIAQKNEPIISSSEPVNQPTNGYWFKDY